MADFIEMYFKEAGDIVHRDGSVIRYVKKQRRKRKLNKVRRNAEQKLDEAFTNTGRKIGTGFEYVGGKLKDNPKEYGKAIAIGGAALAASKIARRRDAGRYVAHSDDYGDSVFVELENGDLYEIT